MTQKYNLFIDMDGVIVDFIKGYHDITGKDIAGQYHTDAKFWEPIDKAGYNFWINLKWTKDGKELWNYIKKYNPDILSSPSRQNASRIGKHDWVQREIPGYRLILRSPENKKEFATPTSILIDDRESNITDWQKAGGIGILHTSAEDTINELKKFRL
jgi:hypothetical protein